MQEWNELLLSFFIEEVCPVFILSAHFDDKVFYQIHKRGERRVSLGNRIVSEN
jgi:hypothetical protein